MKHMNHNAAENQPHKYARPVTPDEMNRMPGQEEYEHRTRTSKVFSLGRGLYQAVMYPEAVHFRDKNSGKLEEIDNTLMPIQDSACGVYLTNRNNDELKVEFHGAQDAAMVLLRNEDDCCLGWKLDGAQDVQPKVVDFARLQESKRDRRRAVLAQLDGEVVYEDIFPDVNLNSAVQALRFKDSFTFKTPESVRKLSFLLFTPEMQTEKQADDSIQVTASDGRTAFLLPRPFLQSAEAEDEIGGVQVDMSATDEPFTWRVTYTPDEKWLQKAKFPVVLDPAVITKNHSSAMEDNFVSSKKADEVQSYGATGMTVSYNSGNWGTSRSFIKFLPSGLPEIDSSYYITKAIFNVKTKTAPTTKASVYLKEVLGDWNSQTITYNNAPALNDKPLDYQYMGANSTWYNYDISNLVRKWYGGENYGFALEANTSTYITLYTSDHAYYQPYVTINYVSLAGLEDYLVYEDQDVGRAGVGHVSLYNGNLIFERQDTSSSGNRMPVSVSHVYNSCYRQVDAFGAGAGWKMNIQQTLHKETLTDSDGSTTFYVYMDGDGTRHHFQQTSGEWQDQSGLGMKLSFTDSTAVIVDRDHNSMTFDLPTEEFAGDYEHVGMLKTIADSCGNTMRITASGCIVSNVQDGIGRNTVFANENNRVSTIYTPGYGEQGTCGFEYDAVNHLTHGNRGQVCYTYDDFKRIVGMRYDDDTDDRFQYTYGANGEVARVKDCARDVSVLSEYDAANRPRRKMVLEGDKHAYTGELVYDAYDNVKTFKEQVGENREKYTTTFTHDEENRPTLMTFGDNQTVTYTYDGLGRVSERSANAGGTAVTTAYTYLDGAYGSNSTTPLVRTMTQAGTELTYTYDETGNIAGISDGQQRITYVYDLLGQLIRVNDPYDTTAGTAGTTWVFAYDHGGNIQKKTAYAYTTGSVGAAVQCDTFAYTDTNWKDKLTALNGVNITYDEIGNPLSDGTWQYKWAQGRQLRGMQKSGEEVAFAYNADGLRVQKTATSTGTTKYIMHGRNLVHLIRGDENLHFFYDAQNKPAMAIYNDTAYAYLYNQQDDVVGMVDSEGQLVVKYQYDAWGQPISTGGALAETLGALNPFRYRGYIYDEETGLYYLRSRYYNPKLSRFINADDVEALGADGDINGYQLFNYCMNDPVNRRDEEGSWSLPNWAKVAIGAALIVGAAVVATVATGGVACFAYGAAIGAAKGAVSGAIGGAISGAIESRIATGSWDGALEAAIDGAADGFLGGAIGGFIVGGLTSPNCFVAGTPIQTENGAVPIEEIVPGQLVWAENPDTGECTLKRVVQLFRNEKYELVHVQVRGATITTTAGHPFFVQGQGWIFAKDLKVGYQHKLLSGGTALVEAVEWEELSEPVTVYNFEVEEFHTYFVGIHGFLVHNLCVQKTVAGDHNGYSARVSVGGEANRHAPHAHIFYKAEKIASVDDMGNILVGKLDRAGKKFVKQNIVQIADGIHKYYK